MSFARAMREGAERTREMTDAASLMQELDALVEDAEQANLISDSGIRAARQEEIGALALDVAYRYDLDPCDRSLEKGEKTVSLILWLLDQAQRRRIQERPWAPFIFDEDEGP